MTGFKNKVIHLATDKQQEDVQLVVNLFQSVLDGFIRGEVKKEEAEPVKVKLRFRVIEGSEYENRTMFSQPSVFQPTKARKKRRKKDKIVSLQFVFSFFFHPLYSSSV